MMDTHPDEHVHPGSEGLEWGSQLAEESKGSKPGAKYNKLSDKARGLISGESQCAVFCGGKRCKYCTDRKWNEDEMAIKGLFSHWVTDNILAMARPSEASIEKHKILDQFIETGIKSVINLQTPGEHAQCGNGNLKSGFSYDPQTLMEKNIFFYNFGWPDYGVGSLSTILDMVKVMQFALSEGKVAVHCHAGLGRTGVLIASYLVFTNRVSAHEAINYARSRRPGCIQTRGQMQVIAEFDQYVRPFRVVFPSRVPGSHEFSLQQYLNKQKHILHGYEARKLKYIPKVIFVVCSRLIQLAGKEGSISSSSSQSPQSPPTDSSKKFPMFSDSSNSKIENHLLSVSHSDEIKRKSFEDLTDHTFKRILNLKGESDTLSVGSSSSRNSDQSLERLRFDRKIDRQTEQSLESTSKLQNGSKSSHRKVKGKSNSFPKDDNSKEKASKTLSKIVNAFTISEFDPDVMDDAESYERRLNESDSTWHDLSLESNPEILCAMMWDWLDQLREPVLKAQDLQEIMDYCTDMDICLRRMEKTKKHLLQYFAKVISKLHPMSAEQEDRMMEKVLSFLTHQHVYFTEATKDYNQSNLDTMSTMSRSTIGETWTEMKVHTTQTLYHMFRELIDTELSKQ